MMVLRCSFITLSTRSSGDPCRIPLHSNQSIIFCSRAEKTSGSAKTEEEVLEIFSQGS